MPDRRKLPSSNDLPDKHTVGRSLSGRLSQVAYVVVFVALGAVALFSSSLLWAFLASLVFVRFIFDLIPAEKTEDIARNLRTGKAGEEAYDETVEAVDDTTSRMKRLKRWLR